ncbi:MAG: PIN domain-containing protein [Dehalococcoidales bacterium]|nr:PIN domain-containing protein [Dehalococcoidales bacterium]
MKADEIAFLDTNILVYAVETDNPLHKRATALMDRANTGELAICLSPQIMGELYSTITNPRKIRKACPLDEAVDIVKSLWESDTILKIYPKQETLDLTLDLVKRYQLKSLDFFDAQIVATMVDNGVTTIYTVNENDFAIFKEIKAVNPFKVD